MKTNLLITKEGIIPLGEGDVAVGNVLTAGLLNKKYDYYIDHQSSVTEGSNMEMFDDEDKLYRFLGNEQDSYIQGGNDNEPPGGYNDEE